MIEIVVLSEEYGQDGRGLRYVERPCFVRSAEVEAIWSAQPEWCVRLKSGKEFLINKESYNKLSAMAKEGRI